MAEGQAHLTVIEKASGVRVVEIADRKILEEPCISEIGDQLAKLVQDGPKPRLILSFKNVEHLSSAALGMLITINKNVQEHQGQLRLADITPQIYEVFKITRLNKLFDIHETSDHALEGL